MPQDLSWGGQPTAVIYSFLKELVALQNQFRTSDVFFFFDSKASLRKQIYPEYKAKRHKTKLTEEELQFEIAFRNQIIKLRKEYLKEIGWNNVYLQSGFESDDLIAKMCSYIVRRNTEKDRNDRIIIISSDHDLYQLISASVSMYNPKNKKEVTLQGFKKEFGILPLDWIKVKAIAGCSSDNVKGIQGVGEKTALKYLTGSLSNTSKVWQKIHSVEGKQIIERNLNLVCLPFKGTPTLHIKKNMPSIEGWHKIIKRLGFVSLKHENPFPWFKK